MNKIAALLAAGMLLSGCVYNSKVSTRAEQFPAPPFCADQRQRSTAESRR